MATTTSPAWVETSVKVEDAPVGVQIWPTRHPSYAPNFTLDRVEIVRNHRGTYVRWVYENGTDRFFTPGDDIVIRTERPLASS